MVKYGTHFKPTTYHRSASKPNSFRIVFQGHSEETGVI